MIIESGLFKFDGGEPECILTGLGFYGEALTREYWSEKGTITELDLAVSVNVVFDS